MKKLILLVLETFVKILYLILFPLGWLGLTYQNLVEEEKVLIGSGFFLWYLFYILFFPFIWIEAWLGDLVFQIKVWRKKECK